jgi:hypothetical protein
MIVYTQVMGSSENGDWAIEIQVHETPEFGKASFKHFLFSPSLFKSTNLLVSTICAAC